MNRTSSWLAAALLSITALAQATPLQVSSSGIYDLTAPSTAFSAPGATWSMSFVVDSQPAPLASNGLTALGLFSTVPFSSFSFLLDGVPIAMQPFYVTLYNGNNGGGIDLFFSDLLATPTEPVDSLSLFGQQYYSGSEFAPTILPGLYATSQPRGGGVVVTVDDVAFNQGEAVVRIETMGGGPAPMPLPGTAALLALGLLLVAGQRRRR